VVDTLRSREVSWADIGEALGVSRQSAWERFS
jgi:biotin operon repressor